MKLERFSIWQQVVYFVIASIVVILLYTNEKVTQYSNATRNQLLPVIARFNPIQYLNNGVYNSLYYIVNFATFHKKLEEMERIQMHATMLINQNKNAELQNKLIEKALQGTYKKYNPYIVKFLYSTNGNLVSEVFFETPVGKSVKINGIALNNNCVIGRVYKQNEQYSYVLMYTDEQFRLPVYTEKSNIFGMVYGGASQRFVAFSSTDEEKIEEGENILIAPADGMFAEGITFGTIAIKNNNTSINAKCNGYYNYGVII